MDYSQNAPQSNEYWFDLADAVSRVEGLGTCEDFKDLVDEKAIRHRYSWTQEPDETLLLEAGCPLIEQLVGRNGGYHAIKDVSAAIIRDETGGIATEISITIDSQDVIIRSRLGKVYITTTSRDVPVITSNYEEISELFLRILASNLESVNTSDLGVAMNEIERAETHPDRLAKTLKHLGNLSGISSETTWSIFTDIETDNAIVVRLTEAETPDDSIINNQLQRYEPNNFCALEAGINAENHIIPENDADNDNFATRQIADVTNSVAFISAALKRKSIKDIGSQIYSDRRNPVEAQVYAKLCQDFLRLYDRMAVTV